jgi:alpha-beta hydrolase superfamily lysophospholipase
VNGLFLNSPFLNSGVPLGVQAFLNPALRFISGRRPAAASPRTLSGRYCQSLHVDYGGEWDFNKEWKSTAGTRLRLSWLAAVHDGQRLVRAGLRIEVPILVMCGAASCSSKASLEEIRCSDSVLSVDSIFKLSTRLGENVMSVRIKDACHDVLLSRPAARERALAVLDRWMTAFL